MKPTTKLWLHKTAKQTTWYYVGKPYCTMCDKEILIGYYYTNWSKKNYEQKLICDKCIRQTIKMNLSLQEYKLVHVTNEPPHGAIPSGQTYPQLTNASNMDTFEAAQKNIAGEHTRDKTKLSGRTHETQIEYVGNPKQIADEEKDQPLTLREADDKLRDLL